MLPCILDLNHLQLMVPSETEKIRRTHGNDQLGMDQVQACWIRIKEEQLLQVHQVDMLR